MVKTASVPRREAWFRGDIIICRSIGVVASFFNLNDNMVTDTWIGTLKKYLKTFLII